MIGYKRGRGSLIFKKLCLENVEQFFLMWNCESSTVILSSKDSENLQESLRSDTAVIFKPVWRLMNSMETNSHCSQSSQSKAFANKGIFKFPGRLLLTDLHLFIFAHKWQNWYVRAMNAEWDAKETQRAFSRGWWNESKTYVNPKHLTSACVPHLSRLHTTSTSRKSSSIVPVPKTHRTKGQRWLQETTEDSLCPSRL